MESTDRGDGADPSADAVVEAVWSRLQEEFAVADLARVRGFLDSVSGKTVVTPTEELHQPDPPVYVPGLRAIPFHEPATDVIPSLRILEDAYPTILAEFQQILAEEARFPVYRSNYLSEDAEAATMFPKEWTAFHFQRAFAPLAENRQRCPQTSRALEAIGTAQEALFSVLAPGGKLPPHSDGLNSLLTVHLGLVIPPDCGIRVGREIRTWEAGRCLLMDTSFQHEAWNRSDQPRVVLIADVPHPDLTPVEIHALLAARGLLNELSGAAQHGEQA